MADRYWVGGTGTWNSTNTTNWSATSGGAGGASVPTSADSVFFDANSNVGTGSFTVTTGVSTRPCLDLTVSGLDGAMTLAGTIGITISGNLSLPASNFTMTLTGTMTFNATTSKTITTNGNTITAPLVFSGTSGTWTLQDALTVTNSVTVTVGTLALGSYTLTARSVVSTGASTRRLAFDTGSVTINGTGTIWNFTGSQFTTTGNGIVTVSNNTATAATVTNTMAAAQSISFNFINGTYSLTITGGSYFNNLNFTGYAGTAAFASSFSRMYGNLDLGTTATLTGDQSFVNFSFEGTGTSTITTNGRTVDFGIQVNSSTRTLQLADSFSQTNTKVLGVTIGTFDVNNQTIDAGDTTVTFATGSIINSPSGIYTTKRLTQVSGTHTLNSSFTLNCSERYTLTAGTFIIPTSTSLTVGSFVSNNTNTRTITFNSGSSIIVNGTGVVWNVTGVTGLTITGTSDIRVDNNTATAATITNTSTSSNAMNFNVISGTYSLTLTTGNSYNNLDFTGFAGTIAFSTTTHTMYGNLVLGSTTSSTATAGTLSLAWISTSGTRTITTNGATANFGISLNGVGQTLQFADAFVQGSTQTFAFINGTLDIASYSTSIGVFNVQTGTHAIINGTLTCASVSHASGDLSIGTGYLLVSTGTYTFTTGTVTINNGVTLSVGAFSSSNSNIRSIAFGTGAINLTAAGTVWNTGTITNFSYTGTSNVRLTNAGSTATTITAGAATAAQSQNFFVTAGTYALTLSASSIMNNLDFTGFSGSFTLGGTVSLRGNITLSSTTTSTSVAQALTFIGSSVTQTVTTAGRTIGCSISIAGTTNIVQLLDGLTQNTARALNLTTGTLDINSQTTSVGILTITTGTHAITNGTLTCASVTHTSGDLSIGSTYNVVCGGFYTFTAGSITINDGATLTVGGFSSANTNTRSIAFGTGNITVFGTGTIWNVTGTTGLSFTGTSNITMIDITGPAGAKTITNTATASSAFNFNFTNGAYTLTLTTGNSYRNLDFTGFSGTVAFSNTTHTMYGNLTLDSSTITSASGNVATLLWNSTSGTRTITSNGATANFGISLNGAGQTLQLSDALVQGSGQGFFYTNGTFDMNNYSTSISTFTIATGTHAITNGTLICETVTHSSGNLTIGSGYTLICTGTYTLTIGTITINDNVALKTFAFNSNNSNAGRSIAFGTSGLIEITGKSTTVWNINFAGLTYTGSGVVRLTATGTGVSSTNITSTTGTLATSYNFEITAGSYPITTSSGASFKSLNFTGYSGTWNNTTGMNMFGDLTLSSTMTRGTSGTITFNTGTYDANLTSAGKSFASAISFNNTGSITLVDSFSSSSSITRSSSGTLVANSSVTVSSATLNGNTDLGSGTWYITGSGTSWNVGAAVTITPGTSTIIMSSSSTKTFSGSGKTYYNLDQGGAGTLTITGSNSFNDMTASFAPSTVTITSGTTQTVSNFTMSGTSGNQVTLNSSTPGSPATLSKASGTVSVSYMTITDSTATGGATWQSYFSNGNTDGGGNSGWDFGAMVAAAIGAFFAFF